jgi:hypothetical protein
MDAVVVASGWDTRKVINEVMWRTRPIWRTWTAVDDAALQEAAALVANARLANLAARLAGARLAGARLAGARLALGWPELGWPALGWPALRWRRRFPTSPFAARVHRACPGRRAAPRWPAPGARRGTGPLKGDVPAIAVVGTAWRSSPTCHGTSAGQARWLVFAEPAVDPERVNPTARDAFDDRHGPC